MTNKDCILCLLNSNCVVHSTDSRSTSKILLFRKGQILFHQDQPNQGLFYIIDGVVKIYSLCSSGKQIIHAILPGGDIAGMSALAKEKVSPYSAEAMEDARVCLLEKNEVLELFRTQPAFTDQFLHKITKAQEAAYSRNDNLINYRVRERMARCLLELSENFGEQTTNGRRIAIRLNREDLASIIGVAPETAIRFLSEFKRKHLITEDDHQIFILDEEALRKVSERNRDEINPELVGKSKNNIQRGYYETKKESRDENYIS